MTLGGWQLDIAKCSLARLKAPLQGSTSNLLMEIPHGNAQLVVQQSGSRDAWS